MQTWAWLWAERQGASAVGRQASSCWSSVPLILAFGSFGMAVMLNDLRAVEPKQPLTAEVSAPQARAYSRGTRSQTAAVASPGAQPSKSSGAELWLVPGSPPDQPAVGRPAPGVFPQTPGIPAINPVASWVVRVAY